MMASPRGRAGNLMWSAEELAKAWKDIEAETVVFDADELGWSNAPMVAKDFHMPFRAMLVHLRKPYKFDDATVQYFRIIYGKESTPWWNQYQIASSDFPEVITFKVLETGEIEVRAIDTSKYGVKELSQMSEEQAKSLLEPRREKHLYNLVYDIIATIDYINNSEYVVTKHTTRKATGEKLSGGMIERRIKIKHTKVKHAGYVGTGKGTKHRYKYRVRGHWREFEDGSRTWVKDHVRGGDGSIFIPKEYEL